MNRRDVIIIAVLVNAGLLVVLFASALKSGNDQPQISVQSEPAVNMPVLAQNDVQAPRGDEVDQVLSQFATVNSSVQGNSATAMAAPVLQPLPSPAQHRLSDHAHDLRRPRRGDVPGACVRDLRGRGRPRAGLGR